MKPLLRGFDFIVMEKQILQSCGSSEKTRLPEDICDFIYSLSTTVLEYNGDVSNLPITLLSDYLFKIRKDHSCLSVLHIGSRGNAIQLANRNVKTGKILTSRQQRILKQKSLGFNIKEIAASEEISESMVKKEFDRITNLMDAANSVEAMSNAIRMGII